MLLKKKVGNAPIHEAKKVTDVPIRMILKKELVSKVTLVINSLYVYVGLEFFFRDTQNICDF